MEETCNRAKIRQEGQEEGGAGSRRLGLRQDFVVARKCLSAGPLPSYCRDEIDIEMVIRNMNCLWLPNVTRSQR